MLDDTEWFESAIPLLTKTLRLAVVQLLVGTGSDGRILDGAVGIDDDCPLLRDS